MTLPLTKLCCKATVWHFGDTEKEAFQCLKDAFTMAPILSYWAPNLPITVETNASDQAGWVISPMPLPDVGTFIRRKGGMLTPQPTYSPFSRLNSLWVLTSQPVRPHSHPPKTPSPTSWIMPPSWILSHPSS